MGKDRGRREPAELADAEEIVRTLAHELEESFVAYLHDEIGFDELTFEVFDTLQAVHAVQSGSYSVEYVDEETETEMPEEPGPEQARPGSPGRRGGSRRK